MSLRARLFLLVALATLIPAILLGIRFSQNRAAEIESALANLAIQANNIANDLDEKIQGTAQLQFGLGRAVDLDSSNRAECSAFLSAVLQQYPQYTGVLTIAPNGTLFCDSLQSNRELDLRDREYFQKALVTKDTVTLQPVFGRLTGISVLQIAYPARSSSGQLKFVLLASFNLQKFANFHKRRLSSDVDILLLDKNGIVLVSPADSNGGKRTGASIAHTDLFRVATNQTISPAQEVRGIDGRTQYWAAARTPANRDAGLYVMVGISKEALVAAANRRLYEEVFELVLVSILLCGAVWALAEIGIRQQIARIVMMAQQLGAGDLGMRIAPPYPSGELGGLMGELNAAAESLQRQHAAVDDLNQKLYHIAHHDTLTGLPNRAAFNAYFAATLERAGENGEQFTILSIDLDRFKETNDVYGHSAGDALLQKVACRLQAAAGEEFIARIGGDEFNLIVAGDALSAAAPLAGRLLDSFVNDFVIEGNRIQIGLGIGGAVYPTDGTTAKALMINADVALYRAKKEPGASVLFFQPEMGVQAQERHNLQQDLRLALERGELFLHYQPLFRISGDAIGFEALARWKSPTRGMVPPSTFIPIAEENSLIIPIGEWAIHEACREAASWPRPLTIAVNVSPIQFHHGDLPGLVHSILLETGLAPGRLELEITEGVLIDDFSRALSILSRLKSLGVKIVLDDFGTGYSSLSYLHSFAFDKIKIDRIFICDLDHNHNSQAIVRAVIGLGHSLEIPILAEGVETEPERTFLAQQGCDEVQGYLTGRPQPIAYYSDLVGRPMAVQQNYAVAG
jgi:diguanylate cyclase (GGDEF)-like protein